MNPANEVPAPAPPAPAPQAPAPPAPPQYPSAARWQPPSQHQAQPWHQPFLARGGVAGDSPWVLHYREQIISDISELVHNQMVTQALGSDFRDSLEIMMQNRVAQSSRDGERALNVIQNLPRNESYRRNDFSHLGIFVSPPGGAAASSGGATAARGGATAARGGATAARGGATAAPVGPWVQEMSSLKVQMSELQNLVRLSFDLQLDLQRAIRQEVAAAMSDVHGLEGSPQVSDVSPQRGNQPASEGHCIICLDNSVDSVLYQCGHMCVCLTCGLRLKQMNSHCPMCRAPIRDVIRAYRCHRE